MSAAMIQMPYGFLMKHVVSILLVYEKDGHQRADAMTGFVMSALDHWFIVTAGHCIDGVDQMTGSGWELRKSCLIDSFHLDVKRVDAVPFPYYGAHPTRSDQLDIGLDYGVLTLSDYFRVLLEKNGIEALNETAWRYPPENAESYWLLGIPGELTEINYDSRYADLKPLLFQVERVHERPQGFSETQVPQFCGRIWLDDSLTSIRGVSGGPIFAFQEFESGQIRYWLVAVQSRWLPESHYISASYARFLGEALVDYVQTEE